MLVNMEFKRRIYITKKLIKAKEYWGSFIKSEAKKRGSSCQW